MNESRRSSLGSAVLLVLLGLTVGGFGAFSLCDMRYQRKVGQIEKELETARLEGMVKLHGRLSGLQSVLNNAESHNLPADLVIQRVKDTVAYFRAESDAELLTALQSVIEISGPFAEDYPALRKELQAEIAGAGAENGEEVKKKQNKEVR